VSTNRRSTRKRDRIVKELESLNEDHARKMERDRMVLWRKIQKFIARNDDIAIEYVIISSLIILLIYRRVSLEVIVFNVGSLGKKDFIQ
jgi:hypothetical protein